MRSARDAMVQFKGPDVTLAAISPVPEGHLGYTADVPTYEYSVERPRPCSPRPAIRTA